MTDQPLRIVIVGGVAGGASAAARARRLSENASITIIERGPDVSFANCGLPYYIGGEISDRERLSVQTPQSLTAMLNVDVLTMTEATSIDKAAKTIQLKDLRDGSTKELPYDKLILAPGAAPIRPPMPGIDDSRICTLRNLQDMDRIREAAFAAKRVVVIGAGFIGLEMAEQLRHLNKEVVLVELQKQVLPQMDPDMTKLVEADLRDNGIELILGDGIASFNSCHDTSEDAPAVAGEGDSVVQPPEGVERLCVQLSSGKVLRADLVILSIGVKPESRLASDAGLKTTQRGHIIVDEWQRAQGEADIYAVGDVVETADRVFEGERAAVPLGGPANRQGRVVADHIFLGDRAQPYPGSLGTAIVRVFDSVAATTGWTEKRLKAANIPHKATLVTDFNHASYYPEAFHMTVKILWHAEDRRLLGAQVTGLEGVDKRIDVLATAILGRMTIDDLCHLELSYAPPFGSAKDPVNIAGFSATNIEAGLLQPLYDIPEDDDSIQLVDVRPKPVFDLCPTRNAINIPLGMLRKELDKLDKSRPVVTVCALGKTSYFGARILQQYGFDVKGVIGGVRVCRDIKTPTKPPMPTPERQAKSNDAVEIDATGLSCPGPILKLKQAVESAQSGQEIRVRANDSDFPHDLPPFCRQMKLEIAEMTKERGIYTATLIKL